MTVGENIKFYRKKAKLTQVNLAKIAKISRSYLADLERNRYNPSVDTLKTIASALGVSISDLMNDEGNKGDSLEQHKTYTAPLSEKDQQDIAKRLESIRKDMKDSEGLAFDGEPMSDEAMESFLEAMEYVINQTKRINKKYTPKKYRKNNTD